jgi:alpha-ketoglutarate-dependent taurine dioxygenase
MDAQEVLRMHPIGVSADMATSGGAPFESVKVWLREQLKEHGLLVLHGMHAYVATPGAMLELMTAFGATGDALDYSNTPFDLSQDGLQSAVDSTIPGSHGHIRVLGNTVDREERPTALRTNIGYQWHQDAGGCAHTMLHCKATPAGCHTLFASTAQMFDRLAPAQQAYALGTEAVYSNAYTAGGPAAFDAEFGLRMNETGTRRVRSASKRRTCWTLSRSQRPLAVRDDNTGVSRLLCGGKNLEYIPGLSPGESALKVEELLLAALGPTEMAGLNSDLRPISTTRFSDQVVLKLEWKPGMCCIWDNRRILHTTTPLCTYEKRGDRVMWQMTATQPVAGEDATFAETSWSRKKQRGENGAPVLVSSL